MNIWLTSDNDSSFSKIEQTRLNLFVFFLAFPAFSVLGNSITFFIFIDLILRKGVFTKSRFKGKSFFITFFLIGIIASIFTPVTERHPGILSTTVIMVQFLYWILIASFVIRHRRDINFLEISKWMFYGTVVYLLVFFIAPINFKSTLISIEFGPGRNALVFNLLCSIPLSFYYIYYRWYKKGVIAFLFLFFIAMLMTNGRAGSIIYIIQMLLIVGMVFSSVRKGGRILLIAFFGLFVFSQTDTGELISDRVSDRIETLNPRLGKLLNSGGDDALNRDKSWLQRKLLISKGKEIFRNYPFLGVGPNNFKYYDSELKEYSAYDFLQGNSKELYNSRSAHNSYIQVLSEFGVFGFVVFLLILFVPIITTARKIVSFNLNLEFLAIVSLIGISIHFYVISAFTGAIPWLIIGLTWAIVNQLKPIKKT